LLDGGRPADAKAVLQRALALWRGPALADFAYESYARAEAARLDELRVVALEDSIEAELALGQHAVAVAELERLVVEQPLRERLWGMLMLALYRSGRQAEALRAYTHARTTLADELGIDPGPALQRLEDEILRQDPALEWHPVAAPATSALSGPVTP